MHHIFNLEHDASGYLIDENYREKVEVLFKELQETFDENNLERLTELEAVTAAFSVLKDPELRAAAIETEGICNSCYLMAEVGSPRAPALCFTECPSIRSFIRYKKAA